jgi:hypothetical protein
MVPSDYHAFFGGCADVADILIGLLFVANRCPATTLRLGQVRSERW